MSFRTDKKGNERYYHAKGSRPSLQWKTQGEPLNNHQPRLGTKRNAGSHGCKCEDCVATAKPIIERVLRKEFELEKRINDLE